jgi:hypothetical protein
MARNVISRRQLPSPSPILFLWLVALTLYIFSVPDWAWGAFGGASLLVFLGTVGLRMEEEHVELKELKK